MSEEKQDRCMPYLLPFSSECEREEVIEGCRRYCSELHVCYSSPDIINIVKKRGIQCVLRKPEQ